jgi:hypothetical protein
MCGSSCSTLSMPGQPFRAVLSDLRHTSNQVWGLAKTDEECATKLEAALAAARRDDLKHGQIPHTYTAAFAGSVGSTNALGWRDNLSSSPRMNSSSPRDELPAPMDREEDSPPGVS